MKTGHCPVSTNNTAELMNNHTRKGNRLKGFNYSSLAWYFVTVCIKDHKNWFGKVEKEKVVLNKYGTLIHKIWQDIPSYYKNVGLDMFEIMPNHIHAILFIDGEEREVLNKNESKYGQLSKVVKSTKEVFTKTVKKEMDENNFQWQRSFYDHIIRSEKALNKIREYIRLNPVKWYYDRDNPNGLWM
jgi:REP-associated tyrosine transposase